MLAAGACPNGHTFPSILRNGCHWDAFEALRRFLLDNIGRLGEATLVSVLSACANLDGAGGLAVGTAVHAYVFRHEADSLTFLGTGVDRHVWEVWEA
ncbi:hypothetical protein ZWY2020_010689 [Hordeum vulgare]|nr:hypothetical protein ZWY2020_010689 [Hordeum vulgare]